MRIYLMETLMSNHEKNCYLVQPLKVETILQFKIISKTLIGRLRESKGLKQIQYCTCQGRLLKMNTLLNCSIL